MESVAKIRFFVVVFLERTGDGDTATKYHFSGASALHFQCQFDVSKPPSFLGISTRRLSPEGVRTRPANGLFGEPYKCCRCSIFRVSGSDFGNKVAFRSAALKLCRNSTTFHAHIKS